MSRNLLLHMAVGACVLMPAAFVQAQENGDRADLRISHGVWRYDMKTEKVKREVLGVTTDTKTETSGFTTFPAGTEFAAFIGDYSLYIYPEATGGQFSFGKAFDSQEAGLMLGINSRKVKDGDEYSSNKIGGYYFYSRPLSSSVKFEFDFNANYVMESEKNVGGTPPTATETDTSGYELYFDALGVVPLAKNVEYVFGIDYTQSSVDIKPKGGKKGTNTESNLGLILAKFRFSI